MIRKTIIALLALFVVSATGHAAEPFVTFTSQDDALPIHGATISCSDGEYEGVRMAIESLIGDFQRVGLPVSGGSTTIVVGTLGKNKEIDKLKLPDL